MKIVYKIIEREGEIKEEACFEDICCDDMRKALLAQETPFPKPKVTSPWFYCPFCKEEIRY